MFYLYSVINPASFDKTIDKELLRAMGIKGKRADLICSCLKGCGDGCFKTAEDVKERFLEISGNKSRGVNKMQLKKDIRECIRIASDYDSFLELMKAKGYEIKGSEFGEGTSAYIAFKPLDSTQFIRGCERSLGKGFTKEEIKEKIESKAHRKVTLPKRKAPNPELIDTSSDRFANSPGLKRWAELQNLKLAASTYSAAGSLAELEQMRNIVAHRYGSFDSIITWDVIHNDIPDLMRFCDGIIQCDNE